MFRSRWLSGAALAALLAASGAAQAASVSFVQPTDGASVTNPVHVVFRVEGMKIAPAGTMTDGTGHHHLLVDGKPLPKGEVIPANDKSLHFGKGQTETDLTLPPGDHTLTLQFGDGAHRSYGPDLSKTITVHVK
ncbi:rod shape-determining protein RodA [Paraburkholderia strydomiana]|nr:rod shape-determining protein RodA [Paraburkholderia strydomiana]